MITKYIKKKELYFLLLLLFFYFLNKLYLRERITYWFIDNYFNDLLGGLVFAILSVWLCRFWLDKELRNVSLVLLTLTAGLFWEYITPFYYERSVTDSVDILFYYLGGRIYIKIRKYFD